jgi:hypothetical protein
MNSEIAARLMCAEALAASALRAQRGGTAGLAPAALINAVVAAQGAAAQRDRHAANGPGIPAAVPKGPKFSEAPQ